MVQKGFHKSQNINIVCHFFRMKKFGLCNISPERTVDNEKLICNIQQESEQYHLKYSESQS